MQPISIDSILSPANVLIVQDSQTDTGPDPCRRLQWEPTAVVYVTFGDAPARKYASAAEKVGRVSVGRAFGRSDDDTFTEEGVVVERITHPTDLSSIGCAVSRFCERWDGPDERLVVCFDSLDSLLAYSPSEQIFHFTHLLTSCLSSSEAMAHVHFDVSNHEERLVSTYGRIFDHVVDERSARKPREATDEEIARTFGE